MTKAQCLCRECKSPVGETLRSQKLFCSKACADKWINRRKKRGEKLYDLFMILRYERDIAKTEKVFNLMCAMGMKWREKDAELGIRSFHSIGELQERMLPHRAVRSSIGFTKRSR